MTRDLNVLVVEDSEDDTRLSLLALRRGGFAPRYRRVQDAQSFRAALSAEHWDAVLADFSLPHFSGIEALNIFRTADLDIPFIFVSGLIGEETAVAAMKAGASDYVMKDKLGRLAPAMARELQQAASRAKHRQAVVDLKLSRDRYMDLYNFAPVGYLTLDRDGRILQLNLTCASLLGSRRDHLRGTRFFDFVASGFQATWIEKFGILLGQGGRFRLELQMVPGDEGGLFLQVDCVKVVDEQGQAVVRAVMIDITDRKLSEAEVLRYEQQVRQMQKMESIGTLAGGIAHDFNNILGAILGNADLAQMALESPTASTEVARSEQVQSYLTEIQRSGERARDLVRQILTFSRHENHQLSTQPLRLIVEDAFRLLRVTVPAGVEIELLLDEHLQFVHADANQLKQVLLNLGTNAWHALSEGRGQITLGMDCLQVTEVEARVLGLPAPGPYAHLWVKDTGRGIEHSVRERIFEPFFTTKPMGKGTGLGLAVALGIAVSHRGNIKLESELGHGSTFHFYLPSVEPDIVHTRPSVLPKVLRGHGEHVIYVDDDETMALVVERMLEMAGFRVSVFHDGLHALTMVREHPGEFDLLVTDFNMPECSGLDLAQEMARVRPEMPVIISSGYITDELRLQAKCSGVRELLEKQYTSTELTEVVCRILADEPSRHVQGH